MANVVDAWQNWAPDADNGITSLLALQSTKAISFQGMFTAPDNQLAQFESYIAPMLASALPTTTYVKTLPFRSAMRVILGVDPAYPRWPVSRHDDGLAFKCTPAMAYQTLPPFAIECIKDALERGPALTSPASQASVVQFFSGGGALRRISPQSTAMFHREMRFVVQYDAYWTAPEDKGAAVSWAEKLRGDLSPYTRGAYGNYVDSMIEDPLVAYYGDNLKRLIEIKRRYDPRNIFNFPQSIPVVMPSKGKISAA